MKCIVNVTTKDGATLKVIEFTDQNNGLKPICFNIERMSDELTRAFFVAKQLNDWQTITFTLERGDK